MAVGVITRIPGRGVAEYKAVSEKLGLNMHAGSGQWPAGLLSHAVGEGDGALVIMDIWESLEAQERFVAERLGPAVAAAGVMGEPERTCVDLVTYRTPETVSA